MKRDEIVRAGDSASAAHVTNKDGPFLRQDQIPVFAPQPRWRNQVPLLSEAASCVGTACATWRPLFWVWAATCRRCSARCHPLSMSELANFGHLAVTSARRSELLPLPGYETSASARPRCLQGHLSGHYRQTQQ